MCVCTAVVAAAATEAKPYVWAGLALCVGCLYVFPSVCMCFLVLTFSHTLTYIHTHTTDELQFEHLCCFLSESNCILLILKFFNQDLWQHVSMPEGTIIKKCALVYLCVVQ